VWERQYAHVIDLLPTFAELAGASYPEAYNGNLIIPAEGVSLLPAFNGDALIRNAPLFWEHEGNRAVRDGKWKLVAKGANGAWQLYDMEADRTELNDLSGSNAQRVNDMAALYDAWAERAYVIKEPAVIPQSLELVSPDGGEVLNPGSEWEIVWGTTETLNPTNVKLEYNAGSGWQVIIASTPHDGSHTWTVPDLEANGVRIRVTTGNGNFSDESDAVFAIRTVSVDRGEEFEEFNCRINKGKKSVRFHFTGKPVPASLLVSDITGRLLCELTVELDYAVWEHGGKIKPGLYLLHAKGEWGNRLWKTVW